jgi:bacillithiol biosynthesis cysteine-adding enzyme BshC
LKARNEHISYQATNAFSKLVNEYVATPNNFASLGVKPVSLDGIAKAIQERTAAAINRAVLVEQLKKQYEDIAPTTLTAENIDRLQSPQTFTITTAHQNNLFTGPLYFIYKILHVIKLAQFCKENFPAYHFVPVFYIGSEDADLAELNHINLENHTLRWETAQTGAVGRMQVDEALLHVVQQLEGEIGVLPHGLEWTKLLRACYQKDTTIATATFQLVNQLFGKYGLVILNPDNPALKKLFIESMRKDLQPSTTSQWVQPSLEWLAQKGYASQAFVRPINLFYLQPNSRQRIEKVGEQWTVVGTSISFDAATLEKELVQHPERFSPNVILRGLYQCTILPDVVFVGGGSEVAYWLQFPKLFEAHQVAFPVLVLRNSWLLVSADDEKKIKQLQLSAANLFQNWTTLVNQFFSTEEQALLSLTEEFERLQLFYKNLQARVAKVDTTLVAHVAALEKKATHPLVALEKKLKRALQKKYGEQTHQLQVLQATLFPAGNLQERHANCSEYFATYGWDWLDLLLAESLSVEQQFTIQYLG